MAADHLLQDSDLILPDWPAPAGVRAFVTTRSGGLSVGPYASFNLGEHVGDDPDAVAGNRKRLRALLPEEPVWLRQVHGNRVIVADREAGVPEADASVTERPETVLAIQIADCMPVLLCDRAGTVAGAAHAGWRGLSSGVIENTMQAMQRPGDSLLAYLGPAIGPGNFEVGVEVRETFVAHDPRAAAHFQEKADGKYLADLYGLARQRLARLGITEVYGGSFCTVAEKDCFFSYRRDRTTGRMAALVWLGR